MTTIETIRQLLPAMNRADKAQVLQWLAQDLDETSPGIELTPGVAGGDACIVRTRIPVWLLVQARHLGVSEADLLRSYPTLTAQDLTNVWVYYRTHRAEIHAQIIENEAA